MSHIFDLYARNGDLERHNFKTHLDNARDALKVVSSVEKCWYELHNTPRASIFD